MSERTHVLVQQWLQQALTQPSKDELTNLTEKYPFFSAAQVLLYRQSKAEGAAASNGKAALHVYNPLILDTDEAFQMLDFPFTEEANNTAPLPATETQKEKEAFFAPADATTPGNEPAPEEARATENIAVPPDAVLLQTTEQDEETEAETTQTKEKITEDAPTETTVHAPALSLPPLSFEAPGAAPAGDLTFEPYHTVDYFASQGIKLSQADASNDKFGKQLKSFTEWLKTMKKLPATAITANTDNAGEKKVENLAAHSLHNTDIITESMAEVWVKQGNWQKASEVYNKLSLQNPSKKAYFAAKIESLKKPS